MTQFTKDGFNWDGMYLYWGTYPTPHAERRFVARFKYGRRTADKNHFVKFLIQNFTVEEYFAAMANPNPGVGPLTILEAKGYISLNTAKALTYSGFPVTAAGKAAYLVWMRAKYCTPVTLAAG